MKKEGNRVRNMVRCSPCGWCGVVCCDVVSLYAATHIEVVQPWVDVALHERPSIVILDKTHPPESSVKAGRNNERQGQ